MIYKDIYISFNTGTLVDANGALLTQKPTISYKAYPTWNVHLVNWDEFGNLQGVDLSEAVSWHAAIDTDFWQRTQPIVRTLDEDIDKSQLSEGIISIPLDAATCGFFEKVDGRDKIPAYFEVRGLDSTDRPIYVYRIGIDCLGAVDAEGGEPVPVVSGGVTLNDVYALLRAEQELQFSQTSGGPWHDEREATDNYYQVRYNEGIWSEPVLIVNGEDGVPGAAATIEIGSVTTGATVSVTNVGTPTSAVFDFVLPSGGGNTYIAGDGISISIDGIISVDSSIATKSYADSIVSGKADNSALLDHTSNTTIHVTAEDKSAWNAKLDSSALNGYATQTYVNDAVSSKVDTSALTGYATKEYVDSAVSGDATSGYVHSIIEAYDGNAELYPTDGFFLVGNMSDPVSGTVTFTAAPSGFISGKICETYGMVAYPISGQLSGGQDTWLQTGFIQGWVNAFRALWVNSGQSNFGCLIMPLGSVNLYSQGQTFPDWTGGWPYGNDAPSSYDLYVTYSKIPAAVGGYILSDGEYLQDGGDYKIKYEEGLMWWVLRYKNGGTPEYDLCTESMGSSPVTGPWYDYSGGVPDTPGAMTVTLPS